jgi:demethylmenaquinone methyltransferase/2-methoxy-6-polyprenyl-1,4-benzoquinol methylase
MKTSDVFDKVAANYDLMNDIMSAGTHRFWKECLIDWLAPSKGMKIIDVAGGTGDIARRFLKRVNGNGRVIVCDPNKNMTDAGEKRNSAKGYNIEWINAPAEDLPFKDNSFDAYIVSFGARNFSDINKSLAEAHRILKSNGRIMCLEFSKVQDSRLAALYSIYSKIIPIAGKIIVGDEKPYKYLTETISKFPSQESFKSIIEKNNFQNVEYKNIFNGVVAIHSAWKKTNDQ